MKSSWTFCATFSLSTKFSYFHINDRFLFQLGITDAFAAFENWSSEAIPDETQRGYEKASQKLNSFLEYEEKLVS